MCVSQNRMVYTYHLENDGSAWVCAGLESTKWAFQSNSSPSKRFTLTVVGCNVVVVFRNTISLGRDVYSNGAGSNVVLSGTRYRISFLLCR